MAYSAALAPTNCQCTLIEATANDALDEPELQISRLKANFSWTAPHGKHRFLYQHCDRLSCQHDADSDGLGDDGTAGFATNFRPRPLAHSHQKRPRHYQL